MCCFAPLLPEISATAHAATPCAGKLLRAAVWEGSECAHRARAAVRMVLVFEPAPPPAGLAPSKAVRL